MNKQSDIKEVKDPYRYDSQDENDGENFQVIYLQIVQKGFVLC